jgi:hypothetical protein
MTKALDLANQRIGRLVVTARAGTLKPGTPSARSQWICQCDCGVRTILVGTSLTKKNPTKSCGCLHDELVSARMSKRPHEAAFNKLKTDSRNFSVDLSYPDFVKFCDTKTCHYCRAAIDWQKHNATRYNLDRKDPSIGYSIENCVVCCSRCNWGKSNRFTYEEWFAMTDVFRRTNGTKQGR